MIPLAVTTSIDQLVLDIRRSLGVHMFDLQGEPLPLCIIGDVTGQVLINVVRALDQSERVSLLYIPDVLATSYTLSKLHLRIREGLVFTYVIESLIVRLWVILLEVARHDIVVEVRRTVTILRHLCEHPVWR